MWGSASCCAFRIGRFTINIRSSGWKASLIGPRGSQRRVNDFHDEECILPVIYFVVYYFNTLWYLIDFENMKRSSNDILHKTIKQYYFLAKTPQLKSKIRFIQNICKLFLCTSALFKTAIIICVNFVHKRLP